MGVLREYRHLSHEVHQLERLNPYEKYKAAYEAVLTQRHLIKEADGRLARLDATRGPSSGRRWLGVLRIGKPRARFDEEIEHARSVMALEIFQANEKLREIERETEYWQEQLTLLRECRDRIERVSLRCVGQLEESPGRQVLEASLSSLHSAAFELGDVGLARDVNVDRDGVLSLCASLRSLPRGALERVRAIDAAIGCAACAICAARPRLGSSPCIDQRLVETARYGLLRQAWETDHHLAGVETSVALSALGQLARQVALALRTPAEPDLPSCPPSPLLSASSETVDKLGT